MKDSAGTEGTLVLDYQQVTVRERRVGWFGPLDPDTETEIVGTSSVMILF